LFRSMQLIRLGTFNIKAWIYRCKSNQHNRYHKTQLNYSSSNLLNFHRIEDASI
jgi:hypothetical protein